MLIYLNKNWKDQYGGAFRIMGQRYERLCSKNKYFLIFNRMVIFSTNDFSNHGHPNPVTCPKGHSRKSIALYYFSKGRPLECD